MPFFFSSQSRFGLSRLEALCFSLMVGLGESYFIAFALFKNISQVSAGLLSTIPMVVGAVVQLSSLQFVRMVGSHKKGVMLAAFTQSFVFVGLMLVALIESPPFWLLFTFICLYWACSYVISPLWNFWMSHVVTEQESTHFFSQRNHIIQAGVFVGLMLAGVLLQTHEALGVGRAGLFVGIFALAWIFRLLTLYSFEKQEYKTEWLSETKELEIPEMFKKLISQARYQKFFSFLFIFYVSIFISSPFVHTFFLAQLKMTYLQYSIAVASLFVAKILFMPVVKKWIEKKGAYKVFILGAAGISPLPALWAFCHDYWFILVLQSVSGAMWAAFEVALSIILFNQIKKEEKTSMLTVYNVFNAVAILLGTTIGGYILKELGESMTSYFYLFVAGAIVRCLIVIAFTQNPLEVMKRFPGVIRLKNYFE